MIGIQISCSYSSSSPSLQTILTFLHFSPCFRLPPDQTLFTGHVTSKTNNSTTAEQIVAEKICACKHTEESVEKISRLNEITTNRFFQAGSLDLKGQLTCSSRACRDRRAVPVLEDILTSDNQDDLERFSEQTLDLDTAENQVATVKVVGGPVLPRPQEGWTITTADAFCGDFIHSSEVVQRCRGLPGVDVKLSLENCRNDVLVRHSNVDTVHTDRLSHLIIAPHLSEEYYLHHIVCIILPGKYYLHHHVIWETSYAPYYPENIT